MIRKYNYYNTILLLLFVVFFNISCAKTDSITGEKVLMEPNPVKRAEASRDSGAGIFGNINRAGNNQTTVNFANTNVLWKASLKTLDFIPLQSVDYAGGILITDWYSEGKSNKEQIKIQIRFFSTELRSESIQVVSYKKICESNNECSNLAGNENFNKEIKDLIINSARQIRIEENKKK